MHLNLRSVYGVLNALIVIGDSLIADHEDPTHRKWEGLEERGLRFHGHILPGAAVLIFVLD